MPESAAIFSVEKVGQVYNKTNEFVYLRGDVNHNANLSFEVDRHVFTQRMVQLPDVRPQIVRPTERTRRAQHPDAKNRGTPGNAVRLRHVEPARIPLRHTDASKHSPWSQYLSDLNLGKKSSTWSQDREKSYHPEVKNVRRTLHLKRKGNKSLRSSFFKKNLNASRPSEYPAVRGGECQNEV